MKRILEFIAILILIAWSLFGTISLSTVKNPFEFLIPFLLLLFPFLLVLLFLSLHFKNEQTKSYRYVGIAGIVISVLCSIINAAMLVIDLIRQ